eukprot:12896140-Prorocentrum_lima.AAC.1
MSCSHLHFFCQHAFAVAAPSSPPAPAKHRLAGGVATKRDNGDARSRELTGLLLAPPRPHGRVCGKVNRHGRKRAVS